MAKEQALHQDAENGQRQELQPELMSIMKEEVGKAKERRIPIIRAFEEIARRSGLKANTIRNYYYRYMHVNEEAVKLDADDTAVDLGDEESIGRPFTHAETKALMREMLISQARGESVRGCANRLGKGNKRMLIRFQNKYRSIIARNPEYVENLIREIEAEGIPCFNPYTRTRLSYAGRKPVNYTHAGSGGQLIDWISQLVSNIQSLELVSLEDFVKGLRDLSSLAAGNQGLSRQLAKHNQEMQDMYNKVQMLENKLAELKSINRRFLQMKDEDKLSNLRDYLDKLQACMQE